MSRRDYVITLRLKGKHHRNIEVQRSIKQAIFAYSAIAKEGEPLYGINTSTQVRVEVFKGKEG